MRFRWNDPENFSRLLFLLWGPLFMGLCIVFVCLTRKPNMHRHNWIALAIVVIASFAAPAVGIAWWWPPAITLALVLIGAAVLTFTGTAPSLGRIEKADTTR
jgi:hypothetical protein